MDHDRFDAMTRTLFTSSRRSRRGALAMAFAAALLGHGCDEILAGKRERKERARVTAISSDGCFPNKNCKPGKGKNASHCDFSFSTVLHNKDVRGANLSNSGFVGANLTGADLRSANLSGSCFLGADLTGARLGSSVNLHQAVFCNTTMPDGSINNSGCEGATPCCHLRVQDCPDTTIACYTTDDTGNCDVVVHTFGPIGSCYRFPTCCPCDHRDQAYWTDRCNAEVPACNGRCKAEDQGILACFACLGPL
ncbi:MAG: pentapeptide repeat-containing protein [Thermomicrobiales bacterium]